MNTEANIKKYAKLIVERGVALAKGQKLIITAPIELADFARQVAKEGWNSGASDVILIWRDDEISRLRFENAKESVLTDKSRFEDDIRLKYGKQGAAFITIIGEDPDAFSSVDPKKVTMQSRTASTVLKPYYDLVTANKIRWTIVAAPTKAWAKKIFGNTSDAIEKLWNIIFATVRVDKNDPSGAWDEHRDRLLQRAAYLNECDFVEIHYSNSIGTDFTIGMPENHEWSGAGDKSPDGVQFFPNMPTEEIFSLPDRNTANGTLVSSMPLCHNGITIENFSLTFKDGRVTDYKAEKGYDTLKGIIETDDGSSYLGEIALVPYDSPISNLGILFFETLFDENASCHFALGEAYPCFKDVDEISQDEMKKRGMNVSLEHVDFMVGTKDLNITGKTRDGREIEIFKDGNFAF